MSFSNYLREGISEGFTTLGFNRFGGAFMLIDHVFIILVEPRLESSQFYSKALAIDAMVHCFVQNRIIRLERAKVLDVSDTKLRGSLTEIRMNQFWWCCEWTYVYWFLF